MTLNRSDALTGACFWLGLALAWALLGRGLPGDFIFDDYYNLRGLAAIQEHPSLASALDFVATGPSSPLGRPLTLATFAAQFADWPHAPEFRRVNILLHLLAGCFVFWAMLRLARILQLAPARASALALSTFALWLLAPLQASAVLYVVQRMAVLSGMLVFLGLLLYLVGRQRWVAGRPRSGLAWCSAGLVVGTGLGVLAKENAALLPLGILALEYTLLAGVPRDRAWRVWSVPVLFVPSLLVLGYLAYIAWHPGTYAMRTFTLGERTLTEARMLFFYLYKLGFPSISSIRLLYDDLVVSQGLLAPATTFVSVVGWAAALVGAVRYRLRLPWLAFGILWYLAHHLLESTVLPLEIAFEHRNYVASLGPVAAACWYAMRLLDSPQARRVRVVLLAGYGAYAAFICAAVALSASLWGNTPSLLRHWGQRQPDSPRAQLTLIDVYTHARQHASAAARLLRAMDRWPGDLVFPLAFLELGCFAEQGPVPDLQVFRDTARRYQGQVMATIVRLDRLVAAAEKGDCNRYTGADWHAVLDIIDSIPEFARQRRNTLILRARLEYAGGNLPQAAEFMDQAIARGATSEMLRSGVRLALSVGNLERARHYVEIAEGKVADPRYGWTWRETASLLRERVEQHAAGAGTP